MAIIINGFTNMNFQTMAKLYNADDFQSVITGLNMASRDKRKSFTYEHKDRLTKTEIDNLSAQDPLFNKIITKLPVDATREPVLIDHENSQDIQELYDLMNVRLHCRKGLDFSRRYGGAATILIINDGQTIDQPVNINTIKDIQILDTFDKHLIHPVFYQVPNVNQGEITDIYKDLFSLTSDGYSGYIHKDRLLIWDGFEAGWNNRKSNNGWGESVSDMVFNALQNYNIEHDAKTTLVLEFNRAIYQIQNFNQKIASKSEDDKKAIIQALQYIQMMAGIVGGTVLDLNDKFTNNSLNLSNLDNVIRMAEMRLCAAADMPHTMLLGESPGSSLSQSGNSQNRDWNTTVRGLQYDKLYPNYNKLNRYIQALMGLSDKIRIDFKPLDMPNNLDIARERQLQADTDKKYLEMVTPSVKKLLSADIIKSRFSGKTYSNVTTLSEETLIAIDQMVDSEELILAEKGTPEQKQSLISENEPIDNPMNDPEINS